MDKIKVNFSLNFVTLLISAVVIGLACYYMQGSKYDDLDSYIKVITAILTLATLVYTSINVNLILSENQIRSVFIKKEFSARLVSEYNSPEMAKLSILSNKLKKDVKSSQPHEIQALLDSDKEANLAIVTMLNFYEKMAISIDHGLADEDLLKEFFKGIITNTYTSLSAYIAHIRSVKNNSKVFDRFEALALRWS